MPRTARFTLPDGRTGTLKIPDAATEQDIESAILEATNFQPQQQAPQQQAQFEKPQSLGSAAFEALGEPAIRSREGLTQIAEAIPAGTETGNLALDVATGAPKVIAETLSEVAPEFVSRAAAIGGAAGRAIGPISKAIKPVAGAVGRAGAAAVEKLTGVKADKIIKLFKKPLSLLTAPTKGKVTKAFSNTEIKRGQKTVEDIIKDANTTTRAKVKLASNQILRGNPQADVILKGRKALDVDIAKLESKMTLAKGGKGALQDELNGKFALREQFNLVLDKIAPKLRAADRVAAQQLQVAPFRDISLPGNINIFSPKGIARAVPGLPSALGAGVSGLGAAAKGVSAAIKGAGSAGFPGGAALALIQELKERRQ